MKKNILSWYYGQGIRDFLEEEKNIILFFWNYFSVFDLTKTLFSPWKRDVVIKYWRGFQPGKTIEKLAENLISRVLGAIVRSVVIGMGLSITIFFVFVCIAVLFVWIFPPIMLAVFLVPGFTFYLKGLAFLLLAVFFVLIVAVIYDMSSRLPYHEMDFETLSRQKWFHRVWERAGIDPNSIGSKNFDLQKALISAHLTPEEFEEIINWEIAFQEEKDKKGKFWLPENLAKVKPIGRQWKYAYTVHLDRYSLDLSFFDPTEYRNRKLIGRQAQLEMINLVLARPDQNNALLVGNAGIGRTTLIHYLGKLTRENREGNYLFNKRLLILDVGRVIGETADAGGDVENELHLLFQEAAYAGNIVLVIMNIENYLGSLGGRISYDISPVLAQYLDLPNFQVLATSSIKEYHRLVERREDMMKFFEVIEMSEPTEKEAVEILLNNYKEYERSQVIFTYKALIDIVRSSEKYKWDVPLPERAIDLAQETLIYWETQGLSRMITPEVVDEFVTLKTGSAQGEIKEEEREKLLSLERILHERVIGQDEAINHLAEALRRARSGINDPKKPIGSFLFLGPTGVGKTETAKALSEVYFGGEGKMIRLDMSEFQTLMSLDRLIGSSQMNQPGQLVNLVKDNPFSLLLLDELEKAHPQILDLFLQVLDEGFLTDAFGEKIYFRNMIIIATSNAGSQIIKKIVEEGHKIEEMKSLLIDYLVQNGIFRLEFLNRFDGVILFRPLEKTELEDVVSLMLKKLSQRLDREKGLFLDFESDVAKKIIEQGYDPIFGARSINRYIEDKVENLIARKIISGEVHQGEPIKIRAVDFE